MYGNHGNSGRCVKGGASARALSRHDCTESSHRPRQKEREEAIESSLLANVKTCTCNNIVYAYFCLILSP